MSYKEPDLQFHRSADKNKNLWLNPCATVGSEYQEQAVLFLQYWMQDNALHIQLVKWYLQRFNIHNICRKRSNSDLKWEYCHIKVRCDEYNHIEAKNKALNTGWLLQPAVHWRWYTCSISGYRRLEGKCSSNDLRKLKSQANISSFQNKWVAS